MVKCTMFGVRSTRKLNTLGEENVNDLNLDR
jgi:hypothetical protein